MLAQLASLSRLAVEGPRGSLWEEEPGDPQRSDPGQRALGCISCLNALTSLQEFYLTTTQVTGDISRLSAIDLIVLGYAGLIVPVMKALSFVMVLMVASILMDMDIATTTTLALGSKELTKHDAMVIPDASEDMAGIAILRPCLMSCFLSASERSYF